MLWAAGHGLSWRWLAPEEERGAVGALPAMQPTFGTPAELPVPSSVTERAARRGHPLMSLLFFFFFLSLLIPYQGSSFLSPPREKWLPFSVLFIYLLDSLGSELRHMGSLLHYAGSFIVA